MPTARENARAEFDLFGLLRILWGGKWLIALATAVCTVGAAAYSLTQAQIFRAEAMVQPRGEAQVAPGLGALVTQLSGSEGLLGLGGGSDRDVAIATLRSRTVVGAFIDEFGLLPKIYEAEWDKEASTWKNQDPAAAPNTWQAYNDFTQRILRVSEDRRTGLVTVAIEWTDPVEAQSWVTELIARTNGHLKKRAIEEGEKNLAYLEQQSQQIGQVELVQAVYGLVEDELKKLMLARGGDEFAFKTIDAAVVPMKRVRPNRVGLTIVGFFLGGMLGVIGTLARASLRNSRLVSRA